MTDTIRMLVDHLRDHAKNMTYPPEPHVAWLAADALERLAARVEELEHGYSVALEAVQAERDALRQRVEELEESNTFYANRLNKATDERDALRAEVDGLKHVRCPHCFKMALQASVMGNKIDALRAEKKRCEALVLRLVEEQAIGEYARGVLMGEVP